MRGGEDPVGGERTGLQGRSRGSSAQFALCLARASDRNGAGKRARDDEGLLVINIDKSGQKKSEV